MQRPYGVVIFLMWFIDLKNAITKTIILFPEINEIITISIRIVKYSLRLIGLTQRNPVSTINRCFEQ